ncbi:alpha-L-fucosidase [Amnibacterium kyonggiense]|uniref:alpha-L-fucosidase n=1 Tax=Amnibacterium kyonggiense TaxID=595671 RepID=A0A4R7FKL0_9MICO|nr:alpha-L-fucosidase [Amnibacterium kyonggiense]TDS76921.1 alpha-L-fucosidase [Amnibacterium kyonggiense]
MTDDDHATARLPKLDLDALPPAVDVSDNTAALARVRAVIDAGPYRDEWPSLQGYRPPRWYQDARFGIFLHWGVYAVAGFRGEWYARNTYLQAQDEFRHHVDTYGPHRDFGYKDLIPSFTMHDFDPDAWAALFRRAGAQFVVPVAEHHDGFAMYATERSRWSAAQLGPRRDVFGDLAAAVDRAWMVRGASSHRAEHWWFMNGGARFDSDVLDPRTIDFYGPAQREESAPNERFLEDWLLRTVEIIDGYRPQVLWFDWWIEQPAFEPYRRMLAAYYYNRAAEWGREVVINYKWDAFAEGSAVYDIERGAMGGIRPDVWQSDTAVSKTAWSWVRDGHDYKTVRDLIAELADTVAKNGVLLLNVGPKPDGTIPEEEQRILEAIGAWLTRNGEAIYGSRPWTIPAEGPTRPAVGSFVDAAAPEYGPADFRFTTRRDVTGDFVHAIQLGAAEGGRVVVRSFGTDAGLLTRGIADVSVLGAAGPVRWSREPDALVVELGDADPDAVVVKVSLEPEAVQPRQDALHG